jgi:hypothetical protein
MRKMDNSSAHKEMSKKKKNSKIRKFIRCIQKQKGFERKKCILVKNKQPWIIFFCHLIPI